MSAAEKIALGPRLERRDVDWEAVELARAEQKGARAGAQFVDDLKNEPEYGLEGVKMRLWSGFPSWDFEARDRAEHERQGIKSGFSEVFYEAFCASAAANARSWMVEE